MAISSEVAEHWACQGSLELWIVLPLLQRQSTTTCAGWTSSSGRVARAGPLPALRLRPTAVKVGYRLSADEPLKHGWMITADEMATALL